MCGIFGYIGLRNGIPIALRGLKNIEYRGYDSAGIGFISEEGSLQCFRSLGKVSQLEKEINVEKALAVIAHTRWATHGKVILENAHPIVDHTGSIAIVHNGIIENFSQLKSDLIKKGIHFYSETDTEVVANLIAVAYEGDLLKAVQNVLQLLKGTWALAVIHKDHPNETIISGNACPLVVGLGKNETYFSSDPNALISFTRKVHFLQDGEVARLTASEIEFFDSQNLPKEKELETLIHTSETVSKGEYEHYTLKEIFDQPQSIRNAMASRFIEESGHVLLDEIFIKPSDLVSVTQIVIVACGTSYHAGMIGSYLFEEMAYIPTAIEISSEYRYKNPIVQPGTLAIAISQSGETADTLAAMRELKSKGAKVFGICNVQGSTLTREADATILLKAGAEVGVCSTKAFTSQLTVLTLLALMIGRLHHINRQEAQAILKALRKIPGQVEEILQKSPIIEQMAKKYSSYSDFFFIGRRYMYPASLEGALKLKEIAYVNANGYAAGEMKHGPIALLSDKALTIALCADSCTYEKMVGNVTESKARLSHVLAITDHDDGSLEHLVDDFILIPKTRDELSPILTTVVCQLFAYYSAKLRGSDVDQPKNLAKSVTVE
ncbi:MAG: glutamine--fructose-6-phosphate transaminase (isomerizing) [Chlamydia sp.]